MNCANSLSQSFPYESLSLLVNNHFTQVALDLARALVPSHNVGFDRCKHSLDECIYMKLGGDLERDTKSQLLKESEL